MSDPREPVAFHGERIPQADRGQLAVRFAAGAAASVLAAVVTLIGTPVIGGAFLAFPAILAAALTFIAEEERRHEAREGAAGAILGGVAMGAFAAVAAALFGDVGPVGVLLIASAAWVLTALLLFFAIGRRVGST